MFRSSSGKRAQAPNRTLLALIMLVALLTSLLPAAAVSAQDASTPAAPASVPDGAPEPPRLERWTWSRSEPGRDPIDRLEQDAQQLRRRALDRRDPIEPQLHLRGH